MAAIPPLKYKERFPYPESSRIEFKASGHGIQKIYETICAFLNTAGGSIFVGISDAGIIDGIPYAEVDALLLNIDNIIHKNRIANSATGDTIVASEVSAKTIKLIDSRFVVCIDVSPRTSDMYVLKTADKYESFFRLNASNLRTKSAIDIARFDYEDRISKIREQFQAERNAHNALISEVHMLTNKLKAAAAETASATKAAATAAVATRVEREDAEVTLAMLHARILEDKEACEKELELAKSTSLWWWWPF